MASQNRNPEIRKDTVNNRWVIFSPARARRPSDFKSKSNTANPSNNPSENCPFCLGREHDCAPEIFRVPENPSSRWRIRVIQNLYPALSREIEPSSSVHGESPSPASTGNVAISGFGFHDVVIESPVHSVRLEDLDPVGIGVVLLAYKKRIDQLRCHDSIKYIQVETSKKSNIASELSFGGLISCGKVSLISVAQVNRSALPIASPWFVTSTCIWAARLNMRESVKLVPYRSFKLPKLALAFMTSAMIASEYIKILQDFEVFKNHGASAGASMSHSHSQIMALPVVPPTVSARLHSMKEHFDQTGRCSLCDIRSDDLLIDESAHFISIVPFAATFPFEIWIIPLDHSSHFHDIDSEKAADLGGLLKLMLRKMSLQLNNPPFNFMIHSTPFQGTCSQLPYAHWFLQIVPQLTVVAGFEMGTGCQINPVFPEDAAKVLREVCIPS
ncbi:hypothetical protein RHMOL_Rhmol04G0121600 [Rhododendron molle]|uniref:Uncharacterized protein n=1 Tax=Rhododendron molle TaxID=49168 RepID=A0ACC0P206_RHOML|nr:hypothetical protein RHMOL_Rhmol04G0121600 [Rhododendron molle]